jgi:DNA-binding response OmpR family regulator
MYNTVLNVDDDAAALYVKSHGLRQGGLKVIEATSGLEALRACGDAGVAIVDAVLPDIPGIEVCRRLKAEHPGLPVVMVSVKMLDPEEQARVLDAGADFFLSQPDSALLVATAKSVLRASREAFARRDAGVAREHPPAAGSERPDARDFAHKLAHDLREPLRAIRMLGSFIREDHGSSLPRQVVERLQAIERHSAELNRRLDEALLSIDSAAE